MLNFMLSPKESNLRREKEVEGRVVGPVPTQATGSPAPWDRPEWGE